MAGNRTWRYSYSCCREIAGRGQSSLSLAGLAGLPAWEETLLVTEGFVAGDNTVDHLMQGP